MLQLRDEDYVCGEDDLANESANVSELNLTEPTSGVVTRALRPEQSQLKVPVHSSQQLRLSNQSSINQISSSGVQLRTSLNEREPSSKAQSAYQPYQIKKPQNLQDKRETSTPPAHDSGATQPARQSRTRNLRDSPSGPTTGQSQSESQMASGIVANESTRRNKLKLFPQKQQHIARFQGARHASSSLTRLSSAVNNGADSRVGVYGAQVAQHEFPPASNGMFVSNLVQQLEQTRRQLAMKER
jgi:hypothetical protein